MRPASCIPGLIATLAMVSLGASVSHAGVRLLSVSPGGGQRPADALLRVIDSDDGSTLAGEAVEMSLPGFTVFGAIGLGRNPTNDTLFALLKVQGTSFRRLVTLDETTGLATDVGDTAHRFAGMAFATDGTLYAVTGDGDGVPEALFTLSTADGSATFLRDLGAGSDGETLAFNPDDGLLYHASGLGTPNNPQGEKFETVDPVSLTITNVPLSGFDYEELSALSYVEGGFFAGDVGNAATDMPRFFRITPSGVVTLLGPMDHVSRGLVPALDTVAPAVPALEAPRVGVLAFLIALVGAMTMHWRRA